MRSPATSSAPDIPKLAADVFGYRALRPGQQDAVTALAAGRDCLAVMPSGAGKSAVYQLATIALGGAAVVVSPLISLQRDQSEHLTRHGIPCPSAHDPRRNSHRSGIAWSRSAIRAILKNPRYKSGTGSGKTKSLLT